MNQKSDAAECPTTTFLLILRQGARAPLLGLPVALLNGDEHAKEVNGPEEEGAIGIELRQREGGARGEAAILLTGGAVGGGCGAPTRGGMGRLPPIIVLLLLLFIPPPGWGAARRVLARARPPPPCLSWEME